MVLITTPTRFFKEYITKQTICYYIFFGIVFTSNKSNFRRRIYIWNNSETKHILSLGVCFPAQSRPWLRHAWNAIAGVEYETLYGFLRLNKHLIFTIHNDMLWWIVSINNETPSVLYINGGGRGLPLSHCVPRTIRKHHGKCFSRRFFFFDRSLNWQRFFFRNWFAVRFGDSVYYTWFQNIIWTIRCKKNVAWGVEKVEPSY